MKPEHELLGWQIAHEELGVYPMSTTASDGTTTLRTEFQDGWNKAVMTMIENHVKADKWLNQLTDEQKDALYILIYELSSVHVYMRDNDEFQIAINCNDLFSWGCSDSEECNVDDLPALLEASQHKFGIDKWCCIKRNQRPQEPLIKMMKDAGVWDKELEALPEPK